MDVSPALILDTVAEGRVLSFATLSVRLVDARGESLWHARYFAPTAPEHPLAAWGGDEGPALEASVSVALARLVTLMLNDVATPYPRSAARTLSVAANVPFAIRPGDMRAVVLAEDDQTVAFVPMDERIGPAGVYVLDKRLMPAPEAAR